MIIAKICTYNYNTRVSAFTVKLLVLDSWVDGSVFPERFVNKESDLSLQYRVCKNVHVFLLTIRASVKKKGLNLLKKNCISGRNKLLVSKMQ